MMKNHPPLIPTFLPPEPSDTRSAIAPSEANEIIEWCIRVLAKHYRESRFDPEESRLVLSKAVGELRRALKMQDQDRPADTPSQSRPMEAPEHASCGAPANTAASPTAPVASSLSSTEAPKPICYGIFNAKGVMHWSESCISPQANELEAELEALIDSEMLPSEGWHIAPMYAAPITASATQAKNDTARLNWLIDAMLNSELEACTGRDYYTVPEDKRVDEVRKAIDRKIEAGV